MLIIRLIYAQFIDSFASVIQNGSFHWHIWIIYGSRMMQKLKKLNLNRQKQKSE